MKKLILLLCLISPFLGFAQSAIILPDAVGVPKISPLPVCNTNEKGKQVFNSTDNKMYYCNGVNWQEMTGGGFTLPYRDSLNTSSAMFRLKNSGGGAIYGESNSYPAITGSSKNGLGVVGLSESFYAGFFESSGSFATFRARNSNAQGRAAEFLGNVTMSKDLDIEGTIKVGEELLVNGKGIVSSNSDKQQKVVRMQDSYSATSLAAGTYKDVTLNYEDFGATPTVTVGQIVNTASTGDWYKVLAIPINVSATSCQIRLYNTSNAAITFNATWHFVIIGVK